MVHLIDDFYFQQHIHPRNEIGNKYSFGNIIIIAGSTGKWGASLLASKAALRAGSGLVTAIVSEDSEESFLSFCPEVMHLREWNLSKILTYDAIGIGPGIGLDDATKHHLKELMRKYEGPMVLDADALNIISTTENLKGFLKPQHVLTPHYGEASRLFGKKVSDYNAVQLGLEFVQKYPCTLILKGPNSKIISSEGMVYQNTSGNDALATAGSGDVLTGIITSFLGKKYDPIQAASLSVFVHGKLADQCIDEQSKSSVIATDLIEKLKGFEL